MEHPQQRQSPPLIMPGAPVKKWRLDENPLAECRDLVRALARKTETLYRECRSDHEVAAHIKTMGLTLSTLTDLVNQIDSESRSTRKPEILEDARGFTYQSVRSCDLDRICDK
jgi:hypothetical protein